MAVAAAVIPTRVACPINLIRRLPWVLMVMVFPRMGHLDKLPNHSVLAMPRCHMERRSSLSLCQAIAVALARCQADRSRTADDMETEGCHRYSQ